MSTPVPIVSWGWVKSNCDFTHLPPGYVSWPSVVYQGFTRLFGLDNATRHCRKTWCLLVACPLYCIPNRRIVFFFPNSLLKELMGISLFVFFPFTTCKSLIYLASSVSPASRKKSARQSHMSCLSFNRLWEEV